MTKEKFYELAESYKLIETTSDLTGYPRSLRPAIVGFSSFDQIEKVASEYGLSIEFFKTRCGWSLWHRTNNKAFEPWSAFDVFSSDFYDVWEKMSFDDFVRNVDFFGQLADCSDFDGVESLASFYGDLFDQFSFLDDDEVLVFNRDSKRSFTSSRSLVEYGEDVWTYSIGLIDRSSD